LAVRVDRSVEVIGRPRNKIVDRGSEARFVRVTGHIGAPVSFVFGSLGLSSPPALMSR